MGARDPERLGGPNFRSGLESSLDFDREQSSRREAQASCEEASSVSATASKRAMVCPDERRGGLSDAVGVREGLSLPARRSRPVMRALVCRVLLQSRTDRAGLKKAS